MAPSANGQKAGAGAGAGAQHRVYIVERRAEFRELNAQMDPSAEQQQPYEPEISYLDFAYLDEKQAYAVAIREQILELDESGRAHDGRKVAAQAGAALKERLKGIHKLVDAAPAPAPDAPVVKFEVLEFPLAPVQPFHEAELLKELGDPSDSEDIEEEDDEDEEELGDDDEEEEVDEGEEGVEEEDDEEEDEEAEDDLEDLDDEDEGEEVDDDDDDSDAAPQAKKQKK